MNEEQALKILGLEKSASEHDIKSAYKKLALVYHPDSNIRAENGVRNERERQFKEINNAHEFLLRERQIYLDDIEEPCRQAGLNVSDLPIFSTMTKEDIVMVGENLLMLFEHGCLNQESFDLVCENLIWPDKPEHDCTNPYASKYIVEALVAKKNLKILYECSLIDYIKILDPLKKLSGDEEIIDVSRKTFHPNLLTQERLNQLIKHPFMARDFSNIVTNLARVDLLTPENEALILASLSTMGGALFWWRLSSKDRTQMLEILRQAKDLLEWALNREKNVETRRAINLKKIEENQKAFVNQYNLNKGQVINPASFMDKYAYRVDRSSLFLFASVYVNQGWFSVDQFYSLHHLMLSFITDQESKNLVQALVEGLVTIEELNNLCHFSIETDVGNYDYLRYLLSNKGITLIKAGTLCVEDVYSLKGPENLEGYIERQFELTVSKAATKIEALARGYLSRKKLRLFKNAISTDFASAADMKSRFRKAAAAGDLVTSDRKNIIDAREEKVEERAGYGNEKTSFSSVSPYHSEASFESISAPQSQKPKPQLTMEEHLINVLDNYRSTAKTGVLSFMNKYTLQEKNKIVKKLKDILSYIVSSKSKILSDPTACSMPVLTEEDKALLNNGTLKTTIENALRVYYNELGKNNSSIDKQSCSLEGLFRKIDEASQAAAQHQRTHITIPGK